MNLKDLGAVDLGALPKFQYSHYLGIVIEVVADPSLDWNLSDRELSDLHRTLWEQIQAKPSGEKQIRTMIRDLEEKLSTDQKKKIEEKCAYNACVNRGIYASLMDGELNRRLKVTPDQRKKIDAMAAQILKRMDDRKYEQTVLAFKSSIFDLPVDSQQEVRDMMGPCVRW